MRYGTYPFIGWSAFTNCNAFSAHHLVAYPPHDPDSPELSKALRIPVFALEQDPWNYAPMPGPPRSPSFLKRHGLRDTREATHYILMLNVSQKAQELLRLA